MSGRSTFFLHRDSLFKGRFFLGIIGVLSPFLVQGEPHVRVQGTPRLAPPIMPRYQAPNFVPTDFVANSLASVPGVTVTDTGGPGQLTTVSFRALSSQNTLVLLDGMPLSGGEYGTFDFAHVLSGSVVSQTLLPGANSVRYGDGATGGVVLLTTPFTSYTNGVTAEVGSFNTLDALASHQYRAQHQRWVTYLQGYRTSGLPQYGETRMKGEKASYKNGTFASAFKTKWANKSLKVNARAIDADGRYDLETDPLPPEPHGVQRYGLAALSGVFKVYSGPVSHRLTTYLSQTKLKNTGDTLSKTTTIGAWYNGGIFWSDMTTSEVIAEMKQSWFTRERLYKRGIFSSGLGAVQHVRITQKWKAEVGARTDYFHRENAHSSTTAPQQLVGDYHRPSYLLGTSYQIADLVLLTSYRTGFRSPSFYDLFLKNKQVKPNLYLRPETTKTMEIGFKYFLEGTASTLQVTQFWTTIKDMIYKEKLGRRYHPINLNGTSRSSGVEAQLNWQVTPRWALVPSYTYTRFILGQVGITPEYPRHKAALDTRYELDAWTLAAQVLYLSERANLGYKLKPYTVMRADVEYKVTPALKVFGRIDNIFDKRYYKVYGYRHKGRTFYVGTSFRF